MAAAPSAGWTVVLAEDGALHACGRGNVGQLGLNSREHRLQPARAGGAELPGGAPVVLVAAGGSHWAAVLEDGAVLTCGSNLFGQLGGAAQTSAGALAHVALARTRDLNSALCCT